MTGRLGAQRPVCDDHEYYERNKGGRLHVGGLPFHDHQGDTVTGF